MWKYAHRCIIVLSIVFAVFLTGCCITQPLKESLEDIKKEPTPIIQKDDEKSSTHDKTLLYKDKELGFRIKYPSDWTKSEVSSEVSPGIRFTPPQENDSHVYQGYVNVSVETLDTPMTLEEYTEVYVKETREALTNPDISASPTTLAGRPAYKVKHTGYPEDGDYYRYLAVWTIKDKKIYRFAYSAPKKYYSSYEKTVEEMRKSFELIN